MAKAELPFPQDPLREEILLIESCGFRRKPTRYRKAGAELSPEPAKGLESS